MSLSLQDAILDLQSKWAAIPGIKAAPDAPPETAGAFPFAVTYEQRGTLQQRSGYFGDEIITMISEIHVSRVLLPVTVTQAMTFRDPFVAALIADPTLGGTVSTVTRISWMFGRMEWGGVPTIGYRFEVDVKIPIVGS